MTFLRRWIYISGRRRELTNSLDSGFRRERTLLNGYRDTHIVPWSTLSTPCQWIRKRHTTPTLLFPTYLVNLPLRRLSYSALTENLLHRSLDLVNSWHGSRPPFVLLSPLFQGPSFLYTVSGFRPCPNRLSSPSFSPPLLLRLVPRVFFPRGCSDAPSGQPERSWGSLCQVVWKRSPLSLHGLLGSPKSRINYSSSTKVWTKDFVLRRHRPSYCPCDTSICPRTKMEIQESLMWTVLRDTGVVCNRNVSVVIPIPYYSGGMRVRGSFLGQGYSVRSGSSACVCRMHSGTVKKLSLKRFLLEREVGCIWYPLSPGIFRTSKELVFVNLPDLNRRGSISLPPWLFLSSFPPDPLVVRTTSLTKK